jgi:hypothetical protein
LTALCFAPSACPPQSVTCHAPNCRDRDPVKLFHAFKDDETIRSADEAIFIAPRKHPETNA